MGERDQHGEDALPDEGGSDEGAEDGGDEGGGATVGGLVASQELLFTLHVKPGPQKVICGIIMQIVPAVLPCSE
jgi:hypothetical protein